MLTEHDQMAKYDDGAQREQQIAFIQIIPSDQAYVDMILDQGASLVGDEELRWEDLVEVDTSSLKIRSSDNKEICLVVTHIVKYKDEPIWKLETKSSYGVSGSSGESAFCTFIKSRGVVRAKIIHKRRTCLGEGRNSTECRNHCILSMISESGVARQQEINCQE
jgi:hypothetical protein